jgi:hypothetical protein
MAFPPSGFLSGLAKVFQPALSEVSDFFKVYLPEPDGSSVAEGPPLMKFFTF